MNLDFLPPQQSVAVLFGAVILIAVFFLIARVINARQPVALAFALMPLLLTLAFGAVVATPLTPAL